MARKSAIFAADEWRSHGSILPACVLGVMLMAVHGYVLGVMIRPLEEEFGWTRAQISAGHMLPSLGAIGLAPLVGMVVDRFGPRRIALLGVPLFCAALAMLSTATANIVSWWVLYSVLGIASLFIFPMVWTAAINSRFVENRGLALAITLSGTGVTASVFPVIAATLLNWQGWRETYVILAAACFIVVFPIVYLSFKDASGEGRPATDGTQNRRPNSLVREMLSPSYIKLASASLLFATAACVMTVNAVPVLLGEGFKLIVAAKIAGLVGVGTITGRICGGLLLDRFDARFVAAGSGIVPMFGAIALLVTQESEGAAMAASLALGIAGGTEYDACAYLTARLFGMCNFGSLFGFIAGLSLFSAGTAPVLANYVYDVTQSYDPVLWGLLPAFALAGILFLRIGPYEGMLEK